MSSLLQAGGVSCFTLWTMRGEYAEFNAWQDPMGKATQATLDLIGSDILRVSHPEETEEIVSAGGHAAFEASKKSSRAAGPEPDRAKEMGAQPMNQATQRRADRREFVARLLKQVPDAAVITGLGSASYDVFAAGDREIGRAHV